MDTKTMGGFTITKDTKEEVTLTTNSTEVEALRADLNALMEAVKALAAGEVEGADTMYDDTPEPGDTPPAHVTPEQVTQGDPDDSGFIPSSFAVVRPDAPPEPEPEPVVETPAPVADGDVNRSAYDVSDVTVTSCPEVVSGVRPAEDTSKHSRGRWRSGLADATVMNGLAAYTKWQVVNGASPENGVTIDRPANVTLSLRDWIAYSTGYTMTAAQVRTTLKRLVGYGWVVVNATGKYGKQDAYSLNETAAPVVNRWLT